MSKVREARSKGSKTSKMANTGTTSDKGCVDIDIYVPQASGGGGASWAEHGERGARAGVPAAPLRAVLHPGHGLGPLLRRLRQVLTKVY